MVDQNYIKGAQIYGQDDQCNSIIFIVQGKVDIEMQDEVTGQKYVLDTLTQGDVIGQYSVLYTTELFFTVRAATYTRVLMLD